MRDRILTPETEVYAYAIAVLFCLGVHSLSALVHDFWQGRRRRFDFWSVHLGAMAAVIAWCSIVVGTGGILQITPRAALISGPIGIGLGWAATAIDRAIVRGVARRHAGRRARGSMDGGRMPAISASTRKSRSTLWILLLIGVFEEIIFRGFLVELCFMIGQPVWTAVALLSTVVVFGLAHVQFGWAQVFSKLPLGALGLASVLLLKSVLAAILIHVLFNWKVWDEANGDLRLIFRPVW
jgi:membrane protease YdiL (CAAX protease family)